MENIEVVIPPTNNAEGVPVETPAETVPKAQLDAVVNELKDLRKKLAVAGVSTDDVDKKIAEALLKKESDDAQKVWTNTYQGFTNKHKEFHPDSDPGGLKKAALDRELNLLNRSGLTTSPEFESILEKARILVMAQHNPQMINVRIDPSIPTSSSEPHARDNSDLSPQELKMIDKLNELGASQWDAERFKKLKARNPGYVEQALKSSNL
jgi:hypothetical protein